MIDLDSLDWIPSTSEPIPEGAPGRTLWVKLGWATFGWRWHTEGACWGPQQWKPGAELETAQPGAKRRDMEWAWGD